MEEFIGSTNFFILLGGLFACYIVFIIWYTLNKRKKNKAFEAETPNVAKVKLSSVSRIYLVDGEKPKRFNKGLYGGFYLMPGEHILNVGAQYTKGLRGKTTVTVRPSDISVVTEAAKEYELNFDVGEERYTFIEKD